MTRRWFSSELAAEGLKKADILNLETSPNITPDQLRRAVEKNKLDTDSMPNADTDAVAEGDNDGDGNGDSEGEGDNDDDAV